MKKDDGGSAFPLVHEQDPGPGFDQAFYVEYGMTLRDYFAAKALQGWLAAPRRSRRAKKNLAKDLYAYADAMLAERSKAPTTEATNKT
jgi:hypothetical protein